MKRRKQVSVGRLSAIGLMTAVLCILGPVSVPIPVTPVPVSLATLVIYLILFLLGSRAGTVSCVLYLLLGMAGLPVFSGFTGGAARLAGPTGGYLIGYIFMAFLSGMFIERSGGKAMLSVPGMLLGMAVTELFGTVWLARVSEMRLTEALAAGVLPFLVGDVGKIILAAILGPMLRRRLKRAGVL